MHKCNDCKSVFEEPQEISEIHFEVSEPDREWFSICPNCGSSDFEALKKCACGEAYITSSEDFCTECYADVTRLVEALGNSRNLDWKDAMDLVGGWVERH